MAPRPDELDPAEMFTADANGGGGMVFVGTKGKMSAGCYASGARLLPVSRMDDVKVPVKYPRVKDGANGHVISIVPCCIITRNKPSRPPMPMACMLIL